MLVLLVEISAGVLGCPGQALGVFAGWEGTAMPVRASLAVEKSAEVVLPAGSTAAGKDPNAKPRRRTLVLVGWMLNAANPARGLGGTV